MGGLTLLEEARAAGLTVTAAGDRLLIRGPRQADGIARELLAHKAEVLALLATPKAQPNGVPHAQLTPREIAWETLAEERWGLAQDAPTPGIDSKAPSRTGPPVERASDPEALAERATIQAEATPGPMAPPGAAPSPTPRPPSPPGGAPRKAGTPAPPALAPSPVARRWCCPSVGCSAGWWEAPGSVIRCRSCEPPHVWWIVAQGEVADAPWVAPFQNRKSDRPRWRREPRPEIPIRFGPEPQRTELQDPGWIQDPEEETFEG